MRLAKGDLAIAGVLAVVCVCVASAVMVVVVDGANGDGPVTQLSNGFTAKHSPDASAPFEPVLYATNGAFAFGFLRVGAASLDLAVVHLASSFPLWRATPARVGDWSRAATLTFDGSLVLTGADDGVLWQTLNIVGDTVALLNSSNLVVRRFVKTRPAWQSFDNPSDTLVLDQNFTVSSPPLISANRRFALRLAKTYMSLHMEFYGGRTTPMYWQHTALEAQPENATQPPVYGRLDGRGFFGLYLQGGGEKVDVLSFDTFVQNLTGAFRRMTLEDDGNLRAYYWTDDVKVWTSDYKTISAPCELPTTCGAYGLCVPGGGGAKCQCLTNSTSTSPPCSPEETTDLCGGGDNNVGQVFDEVRLKRVSVAYKERLPFETNTTAEQCEQACAGNCSCWGAVHNGASGYCYLIDFPVETMVYEADEQKVGYFKVRRPQSSTRSSGMSRGAKAVTAVLSLILASLAVAGAYIGYRLWQRRRQRRRRAGYPGMEQELTSSGPYKDLKSMGSSNDSFKS
ncbi:hypothetical protein E2562_024380 [Oryza meyeriana var. granulata]|uniref:non-specific serine/threonine protein kinase n=1 Tax=Oryza meyeriana var. granulata TaxID=110450 RepID=A0A6G1C8I1_9ORYZ|nr:hypothetical protein E2562_024380 [Oryza meyeriana var. granulata]